MRNLLFALALTMSINAFAQVDYDRRTDKENGALVFKGVIDFNELLSEPAFVWFQKGADAYTPDAKVMEILDEHLPKYNMVVVLGTWCEDSQLLVPRLYKTLKTAQYPTEQVTLIGVDRAKEGKNGEHQQYSADRVPTIILYSEGVEVGRIVEVAQESIEKDLAKIIMRNK
jgi:hypothetical protein